MQGDDMAAKYHFISSFSMTSDPEAVWAALQDVPSWPRWWRWLKRIDVVREATGPDDVGAIYRSHVRAKTGYGFVYATEIAEVEPLRRIDILSSGDIEGRGRFLLSARPDGGTDLSFAWLVETPKWWMNLLAPIARPAFTWNHDYLMSDFGKGLARHTGGELTSVSNETLSPGSPGFHVLPATDS
jgi:uncharacterized protein YndB with AHSA1/START domain